MSQPLERVLEGQLQRYCMKRGVLCLKLKLPGRGFPDRTILMHGARPVFIELKRPGQQLKPAQAGWLATLQNYDYIADVAYTLDDAIGLIELELQRDRSS